MKYKLYQYHDDVILKELINGEYVKILHLSSIAAVNMFMKRKGIILSTKNCTYIRP